MTLLNHIANKVSGASFLSENDALSLESEKDTRGIMALAAAVRDQGFGHDITYSRKIFIPLTQLCRDVCHYCTFAQAPKRVTQPYLPLEEVVELARAGKDLGCKEALFTLGEKPELRYASARKALSALGYSSTLHYLRDAADAVFRETGLLPHMNPGTMTAEECAMLREVSPSMGIMLESAAERLCQKGGVHYGSPDKVPSVRLKTLRVAGELRVPFTSGILIGIGETRRERIEALLALRALHEEFGHIQEI
ncbi:MAG: 7,8-didemethyl-8-hydroxy-5-deazariboflavin synthase CofG, partial [Gammaproteobacteria bacterium]